MKWVNSDSTTWNLIGRNLLHVQNCEMLKNMLKNYLTDI